MCLSVVLVDFGKKVKLSSPFKEQFVSLLLYKKAKRHFALAEKVSCKIAFYCFEEKLRFAVLRSLYSILFCPILYLFCSCIFKRKLSSA